MLKFLIVGIVLCVGIYYTAFYMVTVKYSELCYDNHELSLGCKRVTEKTQIKNIMLLCVVK